MRGLLNDLLRKLLGWMLWATGAVLQAHWAFRIASYDREQRRLRRRYRIDPGTPILSFGKETQASIERYARKSGAPLALTSGSTNEPKRLAYPRSRLLRTRLAFVDAFARAFLHLPLRRKSMFVFASLGKDESLTSMLVEESPRPPPYLSTLQAPYRVLFLPSMRALADEYGVTALRFWALVLSNPGILYSTNPSTLATFLDDLTKDWPGSSRLIRDFARTPERFGADVHRIARRLLSRGAPRRVERIASSDVPVPFAECVPGVELYSCWTGGYVRPFLDQIESRLPGIRLLPMYSMSTETIETVPAFSRGEVAFLPLAPGVLYEFLPEDSDEPVPPRQLEAGRSYSMVVSDPYGLRRYQTDDLFECRGFHRGLPDLHFLRRRGLEYSFTGEKLTAEQMASVFRRVREEFPSLPPEGFLTCVPSKPADESLPHYRVMLLLESDRRTVPDVDRIAARIEELLRDASLEYRGKVESRRLNPVRFQVTTVREFVTRMANVRHPEGWESQFKFLPLYRRLWEVGWTNQK